MKLKIEVIVKPAQLAIHCFQIKPVFVDQTVETAGSHAMKFVMTAIWLTDKDALLDVKAFFLAGIAREAQPLVLQNAEQSHVETESKILGKIVMTETRMTNEDVLLIVSLLFLPGPAQEDHQTLLPHVPRSPSQLLVETDSSIMWKNVMTATTFKTMAVTTV